MRLLFVRHGETVWNATRRLQGHCDIPLSPYGQRQAMALALAMATEPVQALYASDLQRTTQTARILARALGVDVQPEPRLREIAFGCWEGLTLDEIQQQDAETLAARQTNPMHVAPPGGETLRQVSHRVRTMWNTLRAIDQDQTVLLVAHSGSLRVLLCLALGLPMRLYQRFALQPASLTELYVCDRDVVLTRLNDTHHLREVRRDG